MLALFKKEPARIGAMLTAIIALLIDMGISIDPNVALRITALVAIVFGEGVRKNVWNADGVQAEVEKQDPTPPAKGAWVDEMPEV